jgi:hypothetical protein
VPIKINEKSEVILNTLSITTKPFVYFLIVNIPYGNPLMKSSIHKIIFDICWSNNNTWHTFVMKMMMFIMKTTIDIFKDNLLKNGVHRVYF